MRGKRAKALRSAAQDASVGSPTYAIVPAKKLWREIQVGIDAKGLPELKKVAYTGTIRLDPSCTRAIYRRLKHVYKELR